MTTTCIRNADWIVAWNRSRHRHEYLRGGDVAFTGNTIECVGGRFTGKADHEVDGAGLCVMPGLVNIHCHPTNQPITRGVREELGNPAFYMSALYDRTGLWRADDDGLLSGAETAYAELLLSGVTTVVDYAARVPTGWIDLMARSGLRVFAAPAFRDANWRVAEAGRLEYDWDETAGGRAFEAALALVDEVCAHPCGRLGGVIAPAQVDTCTSATPQRAMAAAAERNLMWQTHAGQSLPEFHEMTRRHGVTPIQWLDRIGVVEPRSTIAHAIFTDAHPMTRWPGSVDLSILAGRGATVAHCPVVFQRYGQTMNSLGGYLRAGIHLGVGTDTAPHNMVEEMCQALVMSRTAAGNVDDIRTAQVFHAATVGGARALQRNDFGGLAQGMRADLVLLDLAAPGMRPLRDPIRSLVYAAADRAVKHVYVDGEQVVADGRVLTLDVAAALTRLEAAQRRAEQGVAALDPQGRTGAEISPTVFPLAGG